MGGLQKVHVRLLGGEGGVKILKKMATWFVYAAKAFKLYLPKAIWRIVTLWYKQLPTYCRIDKYLS